MFLALSSVLRAGFVETSKSDLAQQSVIKYVFTFSWTYAAQESVTKFIVVNLVRAGALAKRELSFNKLKFIFLRLKLHLSFNIRSL